MVVRQGFSINRENYFLVIVRSIMKHIYSFLILLFFISSLAQAQENELAFTDRQSIGDGKNLSLIHISEPTRPY